MSAPPPPPLSRLTLRRQLAAAPFDGLLMAGMQLVPAIAKKSLGASDLQIMALMMVAPVCFLLSVYWAELIGFMIRWRRLFLIAGLFGLLPLTLMAPFGSMAVLLGVLLLFELASSLVIPLRNRVMQANHPLALRSRSYARAGMLSGLTVLLVSQPIGRYLDLGDENWRLLFLAIALAGLIERVLWWSIPENPQVLRQRPVLSSPEWMGGPPLPRWSQPIRRMRDVLDRNPQFYRWEMQFMLYGLAFFILNTILPGYLVDGLGLSYSQISTGQVALARLGGVLMLPVMGRYHDRWDPASFCARIFGLLALFPLLMWSCSWLAGGPWALVPFYGGFVLQGVAMSGVMVAWSMSSLAFAGEEDGALYQSIHVTLTGFRGLAGPMLGWLAKTYFGWGTAFALAFALLAVASYAMHRQGRILAAMRR
jgi:hypothetical protein